MWSRAKTYRRVGRSTWETVTDAELAAAHHGPETAGDVLAQLPGEVPGQRLASPRVGTDESNGSAPREPDGGHSGKAQREGGGDPTDLGVAEQSARLGPVGDEGSTDEPEPGEGDGDADGSEDRATTAMSAGGTRQRGTAARPTA
jgi:hypothetical protein